MKTKQPPIQEIRCDASKYNKAEVEFWKKAFLSKTPILSPHIDNKKEVVSFHNCYFALKELQIPQIYVLL